MYKGSVVANGSVLSIDSIGEGDTALVCYTSKENCCKFEKLGDWYYPNGTEVGISNLGNHFYRNRTYHGKVILHQRQKHTITGIYCCIIPDNANNCNINQKLCVNLGTLSSYA